MYDNKGNESSNRYPLRGMMNSVKAKQRYSVEKVYFSERKRWFLENNRPFWIIPSIYTILTWLLFLYLYSLNVINMLDNSLTGIFLLPVVLLTNCLYFYTSYVRFNALMAYSVGHFIYDIEIKNDSIFIKYMDSGGF